MTAAKQNKNDEFYTQYVDIEKEMNAYLEYDPDVFRDKTILLPCDDPEWSNFTRYFAQHFTDLGLKKLISTSVSSTRAGSGKIFTLTRDINVDDLEWNYLDGDGDFRSNEIKRLRDEADVIITNPPFSLFREFFNWIVEAGKQFAVIGNMNAITYKEVFPLIKDNRLWLGATIHSGDREFRVPESYPLEAAGWRVDDQGQKFIRVKGVRWFTNIDHGHRHQRLNLMSETENRASSKHATVRELGYLEYDNYIALEIPYTDAIPSDYPGVMGVPISFLDKYSPEQFEILGSQRWSKSVELEPLYRGSKTLHADLKTSVAGRETYDRIFIRHRATS